MHSLVSKLSTALLGIVMVVGLSFYVVDRYSTRTYYEELTQRLNAPIAMYVTQQAPLIVDGRPDEARLAEIASRAMTINPTVEIYVLDATGRILDHELPADSVVRESVDLGPIREMLAGDAIMPLRGDDPRQQSRDKIFSVSEIRNGQTLEGYLYVVLGGEKYDAIASDLWSSYVRRMSLGAVVAIVAVAGLIGLLLMRLLTRRVRRLSLAVQEVTASRFQHELPPTQYKGRGDEIDALGDAFESMARQIRAQLGELKQNDALRRELVSNISHDLRTPLTTMQGYLETLMIKDDTLSDQQRAEYLGIIRNHSQRLGGLIEDLFELSKLDAANLVLRSETFSLSELLQDVAQEFQLEASTRNIHLEVQVRGDVKDIYADIGLIQRVLENLLRNAIAYTPKGGKIELSVEEQATHVSVAVADTGCGIRDSDLPRIFERFYRADNGEQTPSTSGGIGLAIVKRILDLHGSRITVSSQVGAGTRFEFRLPTLKQAA